MKPIFPAVWSCFLLSFLLFSPLGAQNIGIGTTIPGHKLHIQVDAPNDGIRIDNVAELGNPVLQFRLEGVAKFTLGVDDFDGDKFKIGTNSLNSSTFLTVEKDLDIGIRTTEPAHMFHMVNGGEEVGNNAMAAFENLDSKGVALAAYSQGSTNENNAFEGVTFYTDGGSNPAGVLGLGFSEQTTNNVPIVGVVGHSNLWQGIGVIGSRRFDNGPDNGFGGQFYYDIGYTGGLYSISDARTKSEIAPLQSALDIVNQLEPVSYRYNTDRYPYMGLRKGREFGFLAQDVQRVLPEITATKTFLTNATQKRLPNQASEPASEEFLVVDYARLIPVLTQAIKEQQAAIEALEAEVKLLKKQLEQDQ